MISKKSTLTKKDFQKVIKQGKTYQNSSLLLKVLKTNKEVGGVGVAVAKNITKKAVKRNYYKRVLRNILTEILPDTFQGYYIVLIAQKNAEEKNFEELKKDAQQLIKKVSF